MNVVTLEGIVENGQIRLKTKIRLPEKARVFVIVPDAHLAQGTVYSPRLAHREQIADFKMEVTEAGDADL
jgi:hypothetical protein